MIWFLVSIEYSPQGQAKGFLEKNLRQYSSIGVWFVIALVALAHKESECPKCLS